jgi:hypothetical protein
MSERKSIYMCWTTSDVFDWHVEQKSFTDDSEIKPIIEEYITRTRCKIALMTEHDLIPFVIIKSEKSFHDKNFDAIIKEILKNI